MKLKIFENKHFEDEVYLKLHQTGEGEISLCVCTENGNEIRGGEILSINKDGIRLSAITNDQIGFQLNSTNKSILVHEPVVDTSLRVF